jgi:hypothetical protein
MRRRRRRGPTIRAARPTSGQRTAMPTICINRIDPTAVHRKIRHDRVKLTHILLRELQADHSHAFA